MTKNLMLCLVTLGCAAPAPKAPPTITVTADTTPRPPKAVCDSVVTPAGVDTVYCPARWVPKP